MTLSENIAAREAIIPQIKKVDKQLNELTHQESVIAHRMRVSKDYSLLKELDNISKEIKALRIEADRLDKKHFTLIRESVQLSKALLH
jgi:hypothetical protein